jgi:hypothetical protein
MSTQLRMANQTFKVAKKRRRCLKKRYRDRPEALGALRHLQETSERETVPIRFFWCSRCCGYHLTSEPVNTEEV